MHCMHACSCLQLTRLNARIRPGTTQGLESKRQVQGRLSEQDASAFFNLYPLDRLVG